MFHSLLRLLLFSFGLQFALELPVCQARDVDFEQHVAPILLRRCLECHQSGNPSGGLAIDRAAAFQRGGDSGPVVSPGKAADSLLLQRVEAGEMPPAANGHSRRLPEAEIEVLRTWIESGAVYPAERRLDLFEKTLEHRGGRDWWSFQPLRVVEPPDSEPGAAQLHPIDAFVRAKQRELGFTAAPEAAPNVLIRRLWWDLTGLPPGAIPLSSAVTTGAEKIEAGDYERLLEEMLTSPQHAERWARHWLDVVRYADTSGYERDQEKPFAWKYRDWVVRAIQADMPWDEFIRQQLAGDEIPNRTEQSVIATGFLRLGTWNDEPNDPADYTYERLEDLVHVTSTAFLGLTTKCARCHDHKFDPIPQTDYYRMAAAFWPGPIQPRSSEYLGGPTAEELGFKDVLGWTDLTVSPAPLHALRNGERNQPLQPVAAGSLTCIPGLTQEFSIGRSHVGTTGLRLQLANWIASRDNPLTARVVVNRLWMHHFGEGLVRSTNNFGFTGDQPTHPELLDWLAAELIRSGWSQRHIHRLILTSATWKQSSSHPRELEYQQRDAANRNLWKAFRRRLDAESLRDAFLSSSGELDLRMGGPGFVASVSPEALEGLSKKGSAWTASSQDEQLRRSLYMFSQRSLLTPMMTTFDFCDTTLPCGRRDTTIVAPQALTLMNNDFAHARSETLARRIVATPQQSPSARVDSVWQSILGRLPTAAERQLSLQHVQEQFQRYSQQSVVEQDAHNEAVSEILPVLQALRQPEETPISGLAEMDDCVLYLDAGRDVEIGAEGTVVSWRDQSRHGHHAAQPVRDAQPTLLAAGIAGRPTVSFDGRRQFLHLQGSLLPHDDCTIIAVVTDRGAGGHRELLSNWSGRDGNSTSSLFVGLTADHAVRFSDAISGVGVIQDRQRPFLLTAVNGDAGATLYQGGRTVVSQSQRLPARRLDTPWVIGQQGNIDGEYWQGDVALLLVFRRQLSEAELHGLWNVVTERYGLASVQRQQEVTSTAEEHALASLCLVLFNSNEFAFVD